MLQMDNLTNEFNKAIGPENAIPFINAFNSLYDEQMNNFTSIKDDLEEYKKGEIDRKVELKKDLLFEIATKADIKELKGEIKALDAKFSGEFKSIRLWMKMLIGVVLFGLTCFSSTAQTLIKMLNF